MLLLHVITGCVTIINKRIMEDGFFCSTTINLYSFLVVQLFFAWIAVSVITTWKVLWLMNFLRHHPRSKKHSKNQNEKSALDRIRRRVGRRKTGRRRRRCRRYRFIYDLQPINHWNIIFVYPSYIGFCYFYSLLNSFGLSKDINVSVFQSKQLKINRWK